MDSKALAPALRGARDAQLFYLGLSLLWALAGVVQTSRGQPTLGPPDTLSAALLLGFLAIALVYGSLHQQLVYILASVMVAVSALAALISILTSEPAQGLSAKWYYGATALHGLGLLFGINGIKALLFAAKKQTPDS